MKTFAKVIKISEKYNRRHNVIYKQRIKSADNALHEPRHNDDGAYAKTQPDRHVCNKNS